MVEPTHLKNMFVKMGSSSPIFGVNIKKYLDVATTQIPNKSPKQPGYLP